MRARRERRAHEAGLAAVARIKVEQAAYRPRALRVDLLDDGHRWRWLVWDLHPDFHSGRINGVLVPYATGAEESYELVVAAADTAVRQLGHTAESIHRALVYHLAPPQEVQP